MNHSHSLTTPHSASTPHPVTLGMPRGGQAQGDLFASALLPRQLPVLKWGPEDERILRTTH
jgi:hypothetical protein